MNLSVKLDHSVALNRESLPSNLRHYIRGDDIVVFDSKSEAACAILMERYIPGWRVELGVTYQIKIGGEFSESHADFRVDDFIVEWHPYDARRESVKSPAVRAMKDAIARYAMGKSGKSDLEFRLGEVIIDAYQKARRTLVRATFGSKVSVIFAHTPEDLYRDVIKKFSDSPPSRKAFFAEWETLTKA